MATKIEWTEVTWNPVTGCTPISEGCEHCYAKRMANRLRGRYDYPADEPFRVTLHPEKLKTPLRWRKPRHVFVCSMGDLFHEDVPEHWILAMYRTMRDTPQHIFQVLTKRPERMRRFIRNWLDEGADLPNVWLGVTAENQRTVDKRVPVLLDTPAAVRFVSYEPALGRVDWEPWLRVGPGAQDCARTSRPCLDWLICGGESGPGARPMHPGWARQARDQCAAAGVPFFFKQWGEFVDTRGQESPGHMTFGVCQCGWHAPWSAKGVAQHMESCRCGVGAMARMAKAGKKKAGRLLDAREHNDEPEVTQ